MKAKPRTLLLLLAVLILGGVYYMHSEYSLKGYTAEQLSADPALLDGATLRDGEYSGLTLTGKSFTGTAFKKLVLKDLRIRDCTFKNVLFENVDILPSEITNAVFENCQFVNARFDDAVLRNVLFKDGMMTYKGKYEYYYVQTYFSSSRFDNVVFDGVRINHTSLHGISGQVTFKNMRQILLPQKGGLLLGNDLNVRIDNCALYGSAFVASERGGVYITNSTLKDSGIISSKGILYMENCQFSGGQLSSGTIVVKDSTINAPLLGGGEGKQWHITGTHLLRHHNESDVLTSFEPQPGTHVYINGKNEAAYLYLDKAHIRIQNLELIDVYARYSALQSLDLQNVIIRGGNWKSFELSGGQWENVQIYPTVDITNAKIENLKGYNVTFPEGTPWTGTSGGGASMTVSKTPFEWPEVHVPTPEELDLLWDWPEVTGAPKADLF